MLFPIYLKVTSLRKFNRTFSNSFVGYILRSLSINKTEIYFRKEELVQ